MRLVLLACLATSQCGCSIIPSLLGYQESVEVYNHTDDAIAAEARDAALDLSGWDFQSKPQIAPGGSLVFYLGSASINPKVDVYYHGIRHTYDVHFSVMGFDTIDVDITDFPGISN